MEILKNEDGTVKLMSHYEAIQYCEENNCRLPTLDELINFYSQKDFVKTESDKNWFWSSSVYPIISGYAYVFSGYNGGVDYDFRNNRYAVRLKYE